MKKFVIRKRGTKKWFFVDNGKVFDKDTKRMLPDTSTEAKNIIAYMHRKMDELWNKMGEIDPIWGDLQLYHELENEFVTFHTAIYGF